MAARAMRKPGKRRSLAPVRGFGRAIPQRTFLESPMSDLISRRSVLAFLGLGVLGCACPSRLAAPADAQQAPRPPAGDRTRRRTSGGSHYESPEAQNFKRRAS